MSEFYTMMLLVAFGIFLAKDWYRLGGFLVGLLFTLILTGCGEGAREAIIEGSSLTADVPPRYLATAKSVCDRSTEIEANYDQCLAIYTSYESIFNSEDKCGDNKAINTAKLDAEWDLAYSQSLNFFHSCVRDRMALFNHVDSARQICYEDFERVLLQRVQSCESVFLLVF